MKRVLPVSLMLILVCMFTTLSAQNFDNPGEYMEYLGKQQENISKKYMSYASASAHGKKARKVENLRVKLLDEVQEARMNINGMPSFKDDKSYRDSAVNFMKLYYNVLNDDYTKIINLEDVAEQSYDEMEAYLLIKELVDKKLEEGNNRMKGAETKFAAANNINMVEGKSELGDKMKETSEVNRYYNDLYLLFFKPYKQEEGLMQAVEKGNITGVEQAKNSLFKYAQEGLETLKGIKGYKADNSLVTACKNILGFYVKEAEKMNSITEFYLTKERFEAIKKEFGKKSNPSRPDVDTYNKGINEMNKASQVYNSNNNNLNQARKEALKNWNDTVSSFFDNHTPHYK